MCYQPLIIDMGCCCANLQWDMGSSWSIDAAHRVTRGLALLLAASIAGSCLGDVELLGPPQKPTGTYSLHFLADPEDANTAAALGWAEGLPALKVVITPRDSSAPALELTSSDSGRIAVPEFAAGEYIIDVQRWLTTAEKEQLTVTDDANGFAARLLLTARPGRLDTIRVSASRTRSLVISEWAFNRAGGYQWGGYLELFNNSDTTIYLDGIVISRGFEVAHDYPNFPCSLYLHVTGDSTSIWTRLIEVLPGTGRDYPLPPGGVLTLATDAIDHRPLWNKGLDLRAADFEFIGQPDVDNPSVPNIASRGIITLEHGLKWDLLSSVVVVALPLDLATLPKARPTPESATDWYRLPRAVILDALWIKTSWTGSAYPECPRLVHRVFDRDGAAMRGSNSLVEEEYSISRKRVPRSGRLVLQHTRTGNTDFVRTVRNPGTVPEP